MFVEGRSVSGSESYFAMDNHLIHRLATIESDIVGLKVEVAGIKTVFATYIQNVQQQIEDLHDLVLPKVDCPMTFVPSKWRINFDSPVTPLLLKEGGEKLEKESYCYPFVHVPEEWLESDANMPWPEFSAFYWLYKKDGLGKEIVVDFPGWHEERESFTCLLHKNPICSNIMYAWCAYLNSKKRDRNDCMNDRHHYSTLIMDRRESCLGVDPSIFDTNKCVKNFHLAFEITEYRMWFVATVSHDHWWLYVFEPQAKTVTVMDSLATKPSVLTGGLEITRCVIKNMTSCLRRLNAPFISGVDDWEIKQNLAIPLQDNSYDCGVFVMKYMEFWDGEKMAYNFSQTDIKYFRKQIAATMIMADENKAFPALIRSADKRVLQKKKKGGMPIELLD